MSRVPKQSSAGRQAGRQAGRHLPPPPASRSRSATVTFLAWWNCMYTDRTLLPQKKKLLFWDTFRSYEQWWWTCLCVVCVCVRKFLVCRSLFLSLFLSVVVVRRRPTQILFFFFFFFRFLELSGHSFKIPTQKDAKLPPVYHTYIKSIMQWSTASKIDQPMAFRYMIRRTLIEDTIVQFFEEDIVAFNTINIYINIFTI